MSSQNRQKFVEMLFAETQTSVRLIGTINRTQTSVRLIGIINEHLKRDPRKMRFVS